MINVRSEAVIERPLEGAMRSICPLEIALAVDVRDKQQALKFAANLVHRALGLDEGPMLRGLARREQAGSTALGCGIAIPHARIPGIAKPVAAFMRTRFPIPFDAPDGKPVSYLFVILVPADGDAEAHLQMLAQISQAFTDRAFRDRIAAAETPADIRVVFAQWFAASQAATATMPADA
jgi:nitrogen PTS system EIIA component